MLKIPNYGQFTNSSYKKRFDKRQSEKIQRSFERSDGYHKAQVIRSGKNIGDFDIHLFNLGIEGRTLKEFVSHPNQHILSGDIIKLSTGRDFLVYRQDEHEGINTFGKVELIDGNLRYKVGTDIVDIPFFVEGYGLGSQDPNTRIPLASNRKLLWVQNNEDSSRVYVNQRFILSKGSAFKCTYIDNFSHQGLIVFTMEADEINANDDLDNKIAYNAKTFDDDADDGGEILFNPSKAVIRFNNQLTIFVHKRSGDVMLPNEFLVTVEGIPLDSYQVLDATGNSITIKCLKGGYVGSIVAEDTDTGEEFSIELELRGLF